MRWEDERYVRVYTRDTADWLALGWEARAVFVEIMRKCDRAGIIDLGKHGERSLAAMIGVPLDIVLRSVGLLLEDGCVIRNGSKLVIRNFVIAQECSMSPALRSRAYRERAASEARGLPSQNVTESDASVTKRDASVTKRDGSRDARDDSSLRTVPYRSVPCRAVEDPSPSVRGVVADGDSVAAKSHKAPRAVRGTRLSESWSPKPETLKRFRDRERVDALGSLERFRNHWLAKAGAQGVKVDWEATFRNWVLEDVARGRAVAIVESEPLPGVPADALSPEENARRSQELLATLLQKTDPNRLEKPNGRDIRT